MHTSNLWHVQTRAVAPTFQIKEPTQKQNTTSKPDKNLLSLYFSCVLFFFKEVFGIIHNRSQALRENRLNASPLISFPIFLQFWCMPELSIAPRKGTGGGMPGPAERRYGAKVPPPPAFGAWGSPREHCSTDTPNEPGRKMQPQSCASSFAKPGRAT